MSSIFFKPAEVRAIIALVAAVVKMRKLPKDKWYTLSFTFKYQDNNNCLIEAFSVLETTDANAK